MKKLISIFLVILILLIISSIYKEEYYIIPKESIRIRIVPNSNNITDQYLKKQVKINIESELEHDLKDSKNINTSRNIIKNNLNNYKKTIENVLKQEKSNQKYTIDYGNHYFPEKTYKGVKYQEGYYESLLITLGKGEGDNWWCVLFPPICKIEETDSQKTEYKLYVKEIIEKYLKLEKTTNLAK